MKTNLYNDDCLKVLSLMESSSVDMILTSVPFKPFDIGMDSELYWLFMDTFYKEARRVTKKVICIIQSATNLTEYISRYKPDRTLIWYKGGLVMSYRYNPIFVHQISDTFKINSHIFSDIFQVQPVSSDYFEVAKERLDLKSKAATMSSLVTKSNALSVTNESNVTGNSYTVISKGNI